MAESSIYGFNILIFTNTISNLSDFFQHKPSVFTIRFYLTMRGIQMLLRIESLKLHPESLKLHPERKYG